MSSTVTVKEMARAGINEIRAGKHQYLADEPVDMGGDAGPAFHFIMSGLGACTSMTLRMYAERKELPLRQVTVELSHHKVEIDGVKRDCISAASPGWRPDRRAASTAAELPTNVQCIGRCRNLSR